MIMVFPSTDGKSSALSLHYGLMVPGARSSFNRGDGNNDNFVAYIGVHGSLFRLLLRFVFLLNAC